jgi:hypothetical protein
VVCPAGVSCAAPLPDHRIAIRAFLSAGALVVALVLITGSYVFERRSVPAALKTFTTVACFAGAVVLGAVIVYTIWGIHRTEAYDLVCPPGVKPCFGNPPAFRIAYRALLAFAALVVATVVVWVGYAMDRRRRPDMHRSPAGS